MEDKEAKAIIESLLFMAGEPVSLDSLRKIIEVDKYNTDRLVRELISEYSTRNTGLIIVEVAEGFQMVTNPACSPWIKKLLSTSMPKKLSQSSLETLAIIAYKQPIIKAEIEAIRGVNSDGVVKTLLERRLTKILGRREAPGRPLLYGTTNEFLQYFGLKDLSELPTLKEFQEVDMPEPPETPLTDSETGLESGTTEIETVSEDASVSERAAESPEQESDGSSGHLDENENDPHRGDTQSEPGHMPDELVEEQEEESVKSSD